MKLIKVDMNKCPHQVHTKKSNHIRINVNTGKVVFTAYLTEILGLKDKSKVLFFYDEENTKDWYLKVCGDKEPDAFYVNRKNKSASEISNKRLCRFIYDTLNTQYQSFNLLVDTKANKDGLYAIITRSIKITARTSKPYEDYNTNEPKAY